MENVWTWKGKYFGYFNGDDLWTYDGKHVGRRAGDEIFGPDGKYLGEVRNTNRLITNQAKTSYRRFSFTPKANRGSRSRYSNYVGYVMYVGHTDFPDPESF